VVIGRREKEPEGGLKGKEKRRGLVDPWASFLRELAGKKRARGGGGTATRHAQEARNDLNAREVCSEGKELGRRRLRRWGRALIEGGSMTKTMKIKRDLSGLKGGRCGIREKSSKKKKRLLEKTERKCTRGTTSFSNPRLGRPPEGGALEAG